MWTNKITKNFIVFGSDEILILFFFLKISIIAFVQVVFGVLYCSVLFCLHCTTVIFGQIYVHRYNHISDALQ